MFEFSDKTITYAEYFTQGLPLYALDDTSNIEGWSGAGIIHAGSGTKTITAGNGNNLIYTEAANTTTTTTGSGNNMIILGSGNNVVKTLYGKDTIVSGTGNDRVEGGIGSDTYIFSKGHGQDVIFDGGYTSDTDTLKFTDVASTEVKFGRSGDHLIVFGYNGSDQITIEKFFASDYYSNNSSIEMFEFSDKTITYAEYFTQGLPLYALDDTSNIEGWSGASIIHAGSGTKTITAGNGDNLIYTEAANTTTTTTGSGNNTIILGSGNNVVKTLYGKDTIVSGTGNDRMEGGIGSDTYIFSKGHGQDVIFDGGYTNDTDTLKFTDVASTEVKFGRSGDDLIVFGYNGSDQITIEKFFASDYYSNNSSIEIFEFSDKTIAYAEFMKTPVPAFTTQDQTNLLAAQALSQVMSPASYLMMDESFTNTAPTVGLSPMNAMASNEMQADIAKEVQSLISAMASFGVTEGSIQIDDQTYGYLTPITVPS
jgi:Ca2+-binding RTX toxin-like protein